MNKLIVGSGNEIRNRLVVALLTLVIVGGALVWSAGSEAFDRLALQVMG